MGDIDMTNGDGVRMDSPLMFQGEYGQPFGISETPGWRFPPNWIL